MKQNDKFIGIYTLKTCFFLIFLFININNFAFSCDFYDNKNYQHIVLFGDPHIPGRNLAYKENVVKTVNTWTDVDMVVALGDICENFGSLEEYNQVTLFFNKLNKKLHPILGNHDYLYEDYKFIKGLKVRSNPIYRRFKIKKFQDTFGLKNAYYSLNCGKYLLIFLSTDDLYSNYLTKISSKQIYWLNSELNSNKNKPTIIFFHAPLKGTLYNYNNKVNKPDFIAQPYKKLNEIIKRNKQILLWVSGHTHTPVTNDSFNSKINIYENQLINLHNTDMDRKTIWTNSLYLYNDRIIIKTYNHKENIWMKSMERIIDVK